LNIYIYRNNFCQREISHLLKKQCFFEKTGKFMRRNYVYHIFYKKKVKFKVYFKMIESTHIIKFHHYLIKNLKY